MVSGSHALDRFGIWGKHTVKFVQLATIVISRNQYGCAAFLGGCVCIKWGRVLGQRPVHHHVLFVARCIASRMAPAPLLQISQLTPEIYSFHGSKIAIINYQTGKVSSHTSATKQQSEDQSHVRGSSLWFFGWSEASKTTTLPSPAHPTVGNPPLYLDCILTCNRNEAISRCYCQMDLLIFHKHHSTVPCKRGMNSVAHTLEYWDCELTFFKVLSLLHVLQHIPHHLMKNLYEDWRLSTIFMLHGVVIFTINRHVTHWAPSF